MPQQTATIFPQLYARSCGVLYVYILVAGTFAALMAVAGACYLANSFAHFLFPATGAALFNAGILVPCFVAELSLTLWLLVKGVNAAQWEARASGEVAAR
jgi:hypothetical protein